MQIKMTLRLLSYTGLNSKTLETAYIGEDVESGEYSSTAGGSENLYSHSSGDQYGSFSEN